MSPVKGKSKINKAINVIKILGMPKAQQNERSALCLLALLNLSPRKSWEDVDSPLIGVTPIMDWIREHYGKNYAPNTRETIRRQTMHQFVAAGIALYNPDLPSRPVNSPKAVYQIAPDVLELLRSVGAVKWKSAMIEYLKSHKALAAGYAMERSQNLVPVQIAPNQEVNLSPGEHSELICDIIEEFAPRFVPGCKLVYVGDTGDKWGYFDESLLQEQGIVVDAHGKMPDVILFCPERKWLILAESVTSHGPVDGKRHSELAALFAGSKAGIVYVTAFPNRGVMSRYLGEIAWESEVWVADAPSHLIHFNGSRFLGPYDE
ncbi:MAG: BsuBI/PstI family type II restriction endonuclease [Kiritimatiellia bacterium]